MAFPLALLSISLGLAAHCAQATPPTYWPETLHYGRWEMASKLKIGSPLYDVLVFCGPPSMSSTVQARALDLTSAKNIKSWSDYVTLTSNPYNLSLPTVPESPALAAMGLPVMCDAVMVKAYNNKIVAWARTLALSDNYYQEATCARELSIRQHLIAELALDMNIMGNGPGITKDGRSLVPRMLRYIFHDVLDYNNMILTGGGGGGDGDNNNDNAPAGFLEDMARDAAVGLGVAINVSASMPMKMGGADFCFIDPMESVLDSAAQAQVRASTTGFLANLTEPGFADQNNFLTIVETELIEDFEKLKLAKNMGARADQLMLATVAGLEKFYAAPRLPVKYGRRSGDTCSSVRAEYNLKASLTLSWNKTAGAMQNVEILEHLGFIDPAHAAAIMGAHSIGHVQPCNSGDLAGGGSYCEAAYLSLADPPPVAQKLFNAGDVLPGSVWDTTPMTLDADYFTQLLDINEAFSSSNNIPDDAPDCGGPTSFQCQEDFCYKEEPYEVIVRPNVTGIAVGFTKRVAILSSEIGMLGDSGYLDAVQAMSATPSVFHEKFAEAFDILQSVGYYDVELDVCKPSPCWTTPSDPSLLSCGKDIANQQASLKSVHAIAIADCLDQADGATALSSTGGDLSECEMSGAYGDSLAYLSCGALGQFVCSL